MSVVAAFDYAAAYTDERPIMCFRPAGVDQSIECPECGKKVNAVLGVFPDSCPFCGVKVDATMAASGSPAVAVSGVPAAFGAPAAPKAPGVPGAPAAPGAPRV